MNWKFSILAALVLTTTVIQGCGSSKILEKSSPARGMPRQYLSGLGCSQRTVYHYTQNKHLVCASNPRLLIFDNNPEGITSEDLADKSHVSLNRINLEAGAYSFLSSHVNFANSPIGMAVVLRNETTTPIRITGLRRGEELSVQGQRALTRALNGKKDNSIIVIEPGERVFIHYVNEIAIKSFFSLYSEFEILEGSITLESFAFQDVEAIKSPLEMLDERQVCLLNRGMEAPTHKGVAEYSRLDFAKLELRMNEETPKGRVAFLYDGEAEEVLISNFGKRYICYPHPDSEEVPPNSAGWGVHHRALMVLHNQSSKARRVGLYLSNRVPSARLVYRIHLGSKNVATWENVELTKVAPEAQLVEMMIPAHSSVEMGWEWILATPSNNDLQFRFRVLE